MKEMRLVQEDGTSAVLASSVWRRGDDSDTRTSSPSMGSRGTGSLGGGSRHNTSPFGAYGAHGTMNVTGVGGGSYHHHQQQHNDVAWENFDGIEYLMATNSSPEHAGPSQGGTLSSRPSNSRGFLQHRTGPPATPPFGTASGRSFTPQHDPVIGGLPPPWGVVAPHHATG